MKLSQEKIDKLYNITRWIAFSILIGGFIILVILPKGTIGSWGVWTWLGSFAGLGIIANIIKHWATDEEKQQRKDEMKEVLQEIEAEKKTRTKTVFNGKSPLVDLSPEQIAVVHKFLRDIPDQGDHIKTSELKHILHALEDREDIDMSNREQVIAWVEDITKRSVDTSKFWNEYDWRRSKDQEKKWSKKIIDAFDKLR